MSTRTNSKYDSPRVQATIGALLIILLFIMAAAGIGYQLGQQGEREKQVPIKQVLDGPVSLQLNNLKVLHHSDFNSITVCDTQADQLNDMRNGFIALADYDSDDPQSGPYIMIEDGHNNLLTITATGITKTKVKYPY